MGEDDGVGSAQGGHGLAQGARGKEPVGEGAAGSVDEDDVEVAGEAMVLEAVVEDGDSGGVGAIEQDAQAHSAVGPGDDGDGQVEAVERAAVGPGPSESSPWPRRAVAIARMAGRCPARASCGGKVEDHRGLAGSADGEVADGDDRMGRCWGAGSARGRGGRASRGGTPGEGMASGAGWGSGGPASVGGLLPKARGCRGRRACFRGSGATWGGRGGGGVAGAAVVPVHASEGAWEFDAGLAGEFVDRGERSDEPGEELSGLAARSVAPGGAAVPDGDLVDLEVLDGLDLLLDELGELLDQQECGCDGGILGARGDELAVSLGLGLEDLLDAERLGLVPGEDGVCLASGFEAELLGLGCGGDLDALAFDLLGGDLVLAEASDFLLAFGFEDGACGVCGGDLGASACLGLDLGEFGGGLGDGGGGGVLAGDGVGLGVGDADALLLLCGLLAAMVSASRVAWAISWVAGLRSR